MGPVTRARKYFAVIHQTKHAFGKLLGMLRDFAEGSRLHHFGESRVVALRLRPDWPMYACPQIGTHALVAKITSIVDVMDRLPSEHHARLFLEHMLWPDGPVCPHCRGKDVKRLKGKKCRDGLIQCKRRECRRQFTVTTKTPLHATKLSLRRWIMAMVTVLSSSKGISSVVLARNLGVTQKTAWKIGHAIRELMAGEGSRGALLSGIVEVDEAFVGGAPKYQKGKKNKRGRGTKKQPVLIVASGSGQARAVRIETVTTKELTATVTGIVDRSSVLMTDRNSVYHGVGKLFAEHHSVKHSAKEFVNKETKAHINTAESLSGVIERARVGVYHRLTGYHVQRYLDEIVWRWNRRVPPKDGAANSTGKHMRWKPLSMMDLLRSLLRDAQGRQMRRSAVYGLRWPDKELASFGG